MRYGFYAAIVLFACCVAIWVPNRHASATVERFSGVAVDSSGAFEYAERHEVKYRNGKVVESQTTYFDRKQRKIGELISKYYEGPQWGSYQFNDMRARYEDGVTVTSNHLRLFKRESPHTPPESRILPREVDQVVGQGFHHFIAENLEDISEGRVLPVKLIMPSRLSQYEFRIRKRGIQGDMVRVRIEIDNWVLRMFAPHIDVDYDLESGRLLRYEGMSNLASAGGGYEKVIIEYQYE